MKPSDNLDEKRYVDLHIHTKFSDGTLSVSEILDIAGQKNLAAISITDHDCIKAYPDAVKRGAELGVDVIPGVELSSEVQGIDIHILGYCIDFDNAVFNAKLAELKEARFSRAQKMVKNLNRAGIDLRFETVLKVAGEAAIGRPHIAAALLKEELVYSYKEAFDKYIGYDSPAYVEKLNLSPKEVFDLIIDAHGIPVLAHPGVTKVDERIPEFIRDGLMGIEVWHAEHSPTIEQAYKKICKKYGILMTGGSDFHSPEQAKNELGALRVPLTVAERLKKKYEELIAAY
jgi:predicted metal-dependent phosphoesterase TrpH